MDLPPYRHLGWDNVRQPGQVALLRIAVMFPVALAVLATSVLRSQDVFGILLYAGVTCLALATLLSGTAPYRRFDQSTLMGIGALDLVGVLGIGSLPGAAAAGALVVVPGLWLGGIFRWRGVALVALMGGAAIALAGILTLAGALETGVGRISWIVIFGMVASVAMAATINVWLGQVDLLEAQRAELAAALSALEEEQQYAATIVRTVR